MDEEKNEQQQPRDWAERLLHRNAANIERVRQHAHILFPLLDRFGRMMYNNELNLFGLKDVKVARNPIVFGVWLIVLVFGIFGIWATLAPIDSAAVARGVVVLDSDKKTIQHLEGGIIEEIIVHEGDAVVAGAPLIKLSETAAKSKLDQITGQLHSSEASLARLIAERDGAESINFPEDISTDNPADMEIIEVQRKLFDTRRKSLTGNVAVLNQRINQQNEEITGLRAQIAATQKQIELTNDEIAAVEKLLANGNASRPRLLALQRNEADLTGRKNDLIAQISRAQQTIGESEVSINNQKNDDMKDIADKIEEAQNNIASLKEQQNTASDVLKRLIIRAPQAGVVTGLKVHTVGGVISPGEELMDIVPQNDKLVIEAQVSPQDIDVVRPGLPAKIRLTAYKIRLVPPVEGKVEMVSADRFVDKATNQPYFTARILVDNKSLEKIKGVSLYPGMPAEVLIVTGSRTLFGYMLSPITATMFRAFREQ